MAAAGLARAFVQDNHCYSAARGVLRGLHFQKQPAAQAKLIRVVRGSIFDVAVDIRRASPDYGKWVGLVLSGRSWNQMLVPEGFAHGYLTLEPETEVLYKVSAPYRPDLEGAICFDDSDIAIDWPVPTSELQLSEADRSAPSLAAVDSGF
jgi:dTDP-4-dehydrorhamnose 3,5-epimerase